MRRYLLMAVVAAVAATLTGSAAADGAPARAAARGTGAAPGAQLWVARYNDRTGGYDAAHALAVSPDGSTVFVTGDSWSGSNVTGRDYATVAYSAATGRQLWISRYSGQGERTDIPWSVAVSPDGSRMFVTGQSTVRPHGDDYVTIAYAAASGKRLWLSRYHGPGNGSSDAAALAVSPSGTMVFVTGESLGAGGNSDYATVGYDAATGRQVWVSRYDGPAHSNGFATAVAVGPGGGTVFVTGESPGRTSSGDYATAAYSAATGRQLWVARYNGPANGDDSATAITVSPGGATVFVTGTISGAGSAAADYATLAYSAATGRRLWVSIHKKGFAHGIAVNPDGTAVYVTGERGYDGGYLTVAYGAATGRQLWLSRYGEGAAGSVAVSPDGTTVYVTGGTGAGYDGYATVAYSAAAGNQLWASSYDGPASLGSACCVAVSPDGTTVFVTGGSYGRTDYDYVTVAYRG